jgi:ABC-2 type transport system permease protein
MRIAEHFFTKEIMRLFLQLVRKEMLIFWGELKIKWIQGCTSLITMFIVFRYLMPQMGIQADYCLFIVIGITATLGFYEMVGRITAFVSDLNTDKVISYLLILPIPPFLGINSIAIGWSCCGICLTGLLFPIVKLLMLSQWDLTFVSPGKFFAILITMNIFYGYFALWLSCFIKQIKNTGWLWIMVINPLYMLGCYYCPWKTTYKIAPLMGWLGFLNPMTYVMEGIRASTIGQSDFLPFWICLSALWVFIPFLSWDSYRRLKKKLDFV